MTTRTTGREYPDRRYPDQILTDDHGLVRLVGLAQNAVVTIHGRKINANDIPQSFFTLDCSHTGRGIALKAGDVVFCEPCGTDRFVSRARG